MREGDRECIHPNENEGSSGCILACVRLIVKLCRRDGVEKEIEPLEMATFSSNVAKSTMIDLQQHMIRRCSQLWGPHYGGGLCKHSKAEVGKGKVSMPIDSDPDRRIYVIILFWGLNPTNCSHNGI